MPNYDEHCEDLARYFLEERGAPEHVIRRLAQRVQSAVEDFLEDEMDDAAEKRA